MRFEIHGKMKSFIAGALCSLAFGLWACSGETETQVAAPDLSELFEDVDDAEIDVESRSIVLPEGTSSFKVDNIAALGGNKCYLALDDDPVDPEIDWDNPVSTGTELEIGEEGLRLVVLDDANRVIAVWTVNLPEVQSSSSVTPSSSSAEKVSSSSEKAESSSSEKPAESSSSSVAPASSSEIASSSSEDASSSSEVSESSSSAESSSSEEAESSSSEREEPQLPGSDFSARNDFWATTSDAMEIEKTAKAITVSSATNLEFSGGKATITTREVEGSLDLGIFDWEIDGGWKMAGGFYFSGEYLGQTALDIYAQGYTSGTPSTGDSYIAKDMTFGKAFTARPTAFEITYSYSHEANESKDYPQKSLVYVMLVGKNGKVVATGAFSDEASVEMKSRTVELSYGKDPFGLLSGEYPVAEGLSLGTGEEDVTSIHVMFASSAYAHVVCGGTVGNSGKYRGGENSALVLDDFKLIY
jgi:hypothetical protein